MLTLFEPSIHMTIKFLARPNPTVFFEKNILVQKQVKFLLRTFWDIKIDKNRFQAGVILETF